jgi:tRNA G37 N-methylase TrmD
LENNKEEFVRYVICGKDDINYVVYNGQVMNTEQIMAQCENASWAYNNTAIHLKNPDGKSFFHIQMKGSGKGATYHGVLCHIHEHLFKQKELK